MTRTLPWVALCRPLPGRAGVRWLGSRGPGSCSGAAGSGQVHGGLCFQHCLCVQAWPGPTPGIGTHTLSPCVEALLSGSPATLTTLLQVPLTHCQASRTRPEHRVLDSWRARPLGFVGPQSRVWWVPKAERLRSWGIWLPADWASFAQGQLDPGRGASFSTEWPPASCLASLLAAHSWAWLIGAAGRVCLQGRRPVWRPLTCHWGSIRAGGCLCVVSGPKEALADWPCL